MDHDHDGNTSRSDHDRIMIMIPPERQTLIHQFWIWKNEFGTIQEPTLQFFRYGGYSGKTFFYIFCSMA